MDVEAMDELSAEALAALRGKPAIYHCISRVIERKFVFGEEEKEHFPDFEDYLTEDDMQHMQAVFERRKAAEKADAEVTPEKKEDAKQ